MPVSVLFLVAVFMAAQPSQDPAVQGDRLFREARFEEAEAAYQQALNLDPDSIRGHLGLGRLATIRSDHTNAVRHFSAAYQLQPANPDTILAFAGILKDRESKRTLLQNFLVAAKGSGDERIADVAAALFLEKRLGARQVAVLESPYQRMRIPLTSLHNGGLVMRASLNHCRELRLIVDSGAHGVILNGSAGKGADLEFLGDAAISGFGGEAPATASMALAGSFVARSVTGSLRMASLVVQIAGKEITSEADGVIGLDVFEDFLIHLDPRARVLELAPFEGPAQNACEGCLRALRLGHLLLLQATINGLSDGYFILDTGAPYTLISRGLIRREGVSGTIVGAQGSQKVAMPLTPVTLRLGSRRLWGFEYATLDTGSLSSNNGTSIAGALGYSLLRELRLTIDYREGLVRLE